MAAEEGHPDMTGKVGPCSGLVLNGLFIVLPGIAMFCADRVVCTSILISLCFAGP